MSTYPPTQCGLATFTASLAAAMSETGEGSDIGIVRLVERPEPRDVPEVVHHLRTSERGGEVAAAAALNRFDVAVVQHEYGVYGGPDGDGVLAVLAALEVPSIVVLHTVLVTPTFHQRRVLEQVVRSASVVVVMTETARRRLVDGYVVDPAKVVLIAHGAPTEWAGTGPVAPAPAGPHVPTVLTWGLIGPGKGIEWAVTAVAALGDLDPAPRYVVAGETHPHVLEHEGEAYRHTLEARASALGIRDRVHFENRYMDRPTLRRLVLAADVVVLPYDSTDQVTSGVLIEAVTAGRPVVATAFPHAVELLSSGAGTVVAHRDPAAIADAIRRILVEPGVAATMRSAASRVGPDLTWAAVAARYVALGRCLGAGAPTAEATATVGA